MIRGHGFGLIRILGQSEAYSIAFAMNIKNRTLKNTSFVRSSYQKQKILIDDQIAYQGDQCYPDMTRNQVEVGAWALVAFSLSKVSTAACNSSVPPTAFIVYTYTVATNAERPPATTKFFTFTSFIPMISFPPAPDIVRNSSSLAPHNSDLPDSGHSWLLLSAQFSSVHSQFAWTKTVTSTWNPRSCKKADSSEEHGKDSTLNLSHRTCLLPPASPLFRPLEQFRSATT